MELTNKKIKNFYEKGYVHIPDFFEYKTEIQPIQDNIANIILLVARKHKIKIPSINKLNILKEGFMNLVRINRKAGAEVYDAVKQIPEFLQLISLKKNQEIFQLLRKNSMPGVAEGGYGIRIDIPGESKFEAPWHQEYPAQMRSIDGVVFWSPLLEIFEELGPVHIAEKSHKYGVFDVTNKKNDKEKKGAYALRIVNEECITKKYTCNAPLSKPGDLILMDYLVLHKSGKNISKFPRWTMQWRVFNFLNKEGINSSWQNLFVHEK